MATKLSLSALLTALTAIATYALIAALGPDWSRFLPASCLATKCFCEVPRTGALILQPANSWSSFGFVAVGFWIMIAGRQWSTRVPFSGFPAVWFALTAIVIGVGSFLLHATLTLWGQFLDVVGMYLFSAFTLAYALRRWQGLNDRTAVALNAALCAVLIGLLIAVPETRRWLFAVVLIADIVVEMGFARPRRPGVQVRWYLYSIALQAAAFAIWIADLSGAWCLRDSLMQGHAIWHFLNAAAVYCAYRYYRSEAPRWQS